MGEEKSKTDRRKYLQYFRSWRKKNAQRIREYNKTRKPYTWNSKQHFGKLKYDAKQRNLIVELTFQEYENLIKLPCYLCGELVVSEHNGHGIDRVDNSMGYTSSNCRSCCGTCNRMKRHLSIDDFIIRIKKILTNYTEIDKK